jgi:hypothetical protein
MDKSRKWERMEWDREKIVLLLAQRLCLYLLILYKIEQGQLPDLVVPAPASLRFCPSFLPKLKDIKTYTYNYTDEYFIAIQ